MTLATGNARPSIAAVAVATALLLVAAASVSGTISYFKIYLQKRPIQPETAFTLLSLPKETTNWVQQGADKFETAEVQEVLGTDNYVTRNYTRKPGPGVKPITLAFHAAYYTGMLDTVPHVPDRCFVGAGMEIGEVVGDLPLHLDSTRWSPDLDVPAQVVARHDPTAKGDVFFRVRLPEYSKLQGLYPRLPRSPGDIRLRTMKFLTPKGEPFYSGYFFVANGGTVSRAEGVRLLAFNLDDYYAYYLKIQFTASGIESGDELAEAASDLLDELLPDIMLCVPDWVRAEAGEYPPDTPANANNQLSNQSARNGPAVGADADRSR